MGSDRGRNKLADISLGICIQSGSRRIHGVQESVESPAAVVLLPFPFFSFFYHLLNDRRVLRLSFSVLNFLGVVDASQRCSRPCPLHGFAKRRIPTAEWFLRLETAIRTKFSRKRTTKGPRRRDSEAIAKQRRAKGTARSTTQPSTVEANRWAVPTVYGQWRITRVFYSGQQVWADAVTYHCDRKRSTGFQIYFAFDLLYFLSFFSRVN